MWSVKKFVSIGILAIYGLIPIFGQAKEKCKIFKIAIGRSLRNTSTVYHVLGDSEYCSRGTKNINPITDD
jgi:hypothetical protein